MHNQKGSMVGKSREEIVRGYERYALEQVRGMRQRAAEELQRLRDMEEPDAWGQGSESSVWRAEARLSSWDRAVAALEEEFKPLSKSARKKANKRAAAARREAETGAGQAETATGEAETKVVEVEALSE